MKEKIANFIKNNVLVTATISIMSVIYLVMMFTNKPWYDELYTYYSFISRGPVYAAIHWPVPNNHVGYSVLSACLNIFHNQYISLRGVSLIAAIVNLILIYKIGCKIMKKEYAFISMLIYAGANIIHMLSIQGRGYSLAITCFLLASLFGQKLCLKDVKVIDYIIFAISLTAGLYIIPSSMYWVIPICLICLFFLLLKKEWKRLLYTFVTCVIAAVATVFLYTIIWLAIGSNLLSKDSSSEFYGIYQVEIILKAPIAAARRGIEYMLATPYIQSISRRASTVGMPGYFEEFFSQCYTYCGIALTLIMAVLILLFACYSVLEFRNDVDAVWTSFYLGGLLFLPVAMLLIQSVHPYKRVMSFIMVPVALGMMYLLSIWIDYCEIKKKIPKIELIIMVVVILFVAIKMCTYDYRRPLADRENDIEALLKTIDVSDIDSIFYTDDYQKYVLKFYHDAEPEEKAIEEARYVIIASEIRTPQYTENVWPVLMPTNQPFLKYVDDNFEEIVASEKYAVYCRK